MLNTKKKLMASTTNTLYTTKIFNTRFDKKYKNFSRIIHIIGINIHQVDIVLYSSKKFITV